jgi:hypothetical protein
MKPPGVARRSPIGITLRGDTDADPPAPNGASNSVILDPRLEELSYS